jgi:hypothetical protein
VLCHPEHGCFALRETAEAGRQSLRPPRLTGLLGSPDVHPPGRIDAPAQPNTPALSVGRPRISFPGPGNASKQSPGVGAAVGTASRNVGRGFRAIWIQASQRAVANYQSTNTAGSVLQRGDCLRLSLPRLAEFQGVPLRRLTHEHDSQALCDAHAENVSALQRHCLTNPLRQTARLVRKMRCTVPISLDVLLRPN